MNYKNTLAAIALAAAAFPATSLALACGDAIGVPGVVNLTADLGPCPGDGLKIETSGVTVNLNGFKITGSGVANGINLRNGSTIEINGPGTIVGFGTGVFKTGMPESGLTVYKVSFLKNSSGIFLSKQNNAVLHANTIYGGSSGVYLIEVNNVIIDENSISRIAGPGVYATNSLNVWVAHNIINKNVDGVVGVPGPSGLSMRVASNQLQSNTQDGARIGIAFGGPVFLYGNEASSNLRDGLSFIGSAAASTSAARGNRAINNGRRGVGVTGDRWRVINNTLTPNSVSDIFWDGIGANTCFSSNVFVTSVPGALPGC